MNLAVSDTACALEIETAHIGILVADPVLTLGTYS
jgi:hypothetical protein